LSPVFSFLFSFCLENEERPLKKTRASVSDKDGLIIIFGLFIHLISIILVEVLNSDDASADQRSMKIFLFMIFQKQSRMNRNPELIRVQILIVEVRIIIELIEFS
jgi:uncharacterized protein YhhL (DUF1145 family)